MLITEVLQCKLVRKEDDRAAEVVEYQHSSGIQHILDLFQSQIQSNAIVVGGRALSHKVAQGVLSVGHQHPAGD